MLAAAAVVPAFADDNTTTTETTARTLYWKGTQNYSNWSGALWAESNTATERTTFTAGDNAIINGTDVLQNNVDIDSNVSAGSISVIGGTSGNPAKVYFRVGTDGDVSLTADTLSVSTTSTLGFVVAGKLTGTFAATSGNVEVTQSKTGTIDLGGASFAAGTNLTLVNGTTIVNGEQSAFCGNLVVGKSATAVIGGSDDASWFMQKGCANQTVTVQGTLDLGTEGRIYWWSNDESGKLVLDGGTIKGNYKWGEETSLQVQCSTTVSVTSTSAIESGIRVMVESILTLDTADDATLTVSGKVKNYADASSIGGLKKTGAGSLVLSGDNSFGGSSCGFEIAEGTVEAASKTALGAGAVTVASAATLQIDVAAVAATGGITFREGAKLALADTLFSGVTESVDVLVASTMTFGSTTLTDGDVTETVSGYVTGATSNVKKWTYNATTGALTAVIPEPSAFGLLAGLGALALAISRRRRNHKKF